MTTARESAATTTAPIAVLDDADVVAAALTPLRRKLLRLLLEPHSASTLATVTDLPRQKVNYHLRQLERLGLVELVAERPRRGFTERLFRTTADRVLIDPELLSYGLPSLPAADRESAAHLAATAAQVVHDIGDLMQAAGADGRRLATVTLDATITLTTPDDLRAFVADLGELVARHDRPGTTDGRRYRFVALAHPAVTHQTLYEEDAP